MLSVGWSWFSYLSGFVFRGRGVHVLVPVSPSGGRWVRWVVVVVVLVSAVSVRGGITARHEGGPRDQEQKSLAKS